MDALIKKSRETELIRVAEPNAAAEDAGDQFSFQSPRTRRRRWTIRTSTRLFSRPRTASMASMVRQSVAARKHVFCERPLALTRRIAEWFGVEWVRAADEMVPLETQMAKDAQVWKGMADEYGLAEPDLWRVGLALAHGSRLEPADRSDDGHGARAGSWAFLLTRTRRTHSSICSRRCARTGSFPECQTHPPGQRNRRGWKFRANARTRQARPRDITVRPQYWEDPVESGRTLFG